MIFLVLFFPFLIHRDRWVSLPNPFMVLDDKVESINRNLDICINPFITEKFIKNN